MPVTETGYLCVADRVAELGLHVPNGFAILPDNFAQAASSTDFRLRAEAAAVRSLFWGRQLPLENLRTRDDVRAGEEDGRQLEDHAVCTGQCHEAGSRSPQRRASGDFGSPERPAAKIAAQTRQPEPDCGEKQRPHVPETDLRERYFRLCLTCGKSDKNRGHVTRTGRVFRWLDGWHRKTPRSS